MINILDQENEMQKSVVNMWDAVMNHEINPLKHIDDLQTRHVVMQFLAWMWCIIFSAALGSFLVFGISLIAHVLLVAGITITYSTFQVAKRTSQRGATQYRGAD